MRYGFTLLLLGLAQVALAFGMGAPALLPCLLGWSGLSWSLVGVAYLGIGAKVFGKRDDGSLTAWKVLLLLPYLLVTWLLWFLQTRLTKEPTYHEIVPSLWLGRRCSAGELPPGVETIVDLTAEFGEPASVRQGRRYLCVPTLDASVPSRDDFDRLVREAVASSGPVYVHCALGHGRSATVVAALLIARGEAASIEAAERIVKAARPGVEVKPPQRELLEQWDEGRKQPS